MPTPYRRIRSHPITLSLLFAVIGVIISKLPFLHPYHSLSVILQYAAMGFLLGHYLTTERAKAASHDAVIALMNHHVRNALNVIQNRQWIGEDKREEAVHDACLRIKWAVEEVLPEITRRSGQVVLESRLNSFDKKEK